MRALWPKLIGVRINRRYQCHLSRRTPKFTRVNPSTGGSHIHGKSASSVDNWRQSP